jgi:hypothetical protein
LYDHSTLEEARMRRRFITALTATVAFGAIGVFAQDGDLSGVTMRVLDDVSDIDAVILELDGNRGEDADGSERDAADSGEESSADRSAAEAEKDRFAEQRAELHDPDDDERSEGKLEDNDIERPAAPTP